MYVLARLAGVSIVPKEELWPECTYTYSYMYYNYTSAYLAVAAVATCGNYQHS